MGANVCRLHEQILLQDNYFQGEWGVGEPRGSSEGVSRTMANSSDFDVETNHLGDHCHRAQGGDGG